MSSKPCILIVSLNPNFHTKFSTKPKMTKSQNAKQKSQNVQKAIMLQDITTCLEDMGMNLKPSSLQVLCMGSLEGKKVTLSTNGAEANVEQVEKLEVLGALGSMAKAKPVSALSTGLVKPQACSGNTERCSLRKVLRWTN